MARSAPEVPTARQSEDERLQSLGYKPQLNRVLGLFANFSVAFTYLSPMVGIYSLFALGVGTGGPAYLWLMVIPVIGMLLVALVFGELASHYPVAGALYQYSKFSVGPGYGWFVGWFYGIALLVTVAAVDTGVVPYVVSLCNNWFSTTLDPASHGTILTITVILLAIQTMLNITGAKVMGRVAQFGVYVEILGTLGIAIILAISGFHHGLSFLFSSEGVTHAATNPLGLDFGGHWLTGAALIAVLAHVYIFYGFESAGDIAEETKNAGRQVPRAMRYALIWGGIASFILVAALLLAIPAGPHAIADTAKGGVPFILSELPGWLQDGLLLLIIFAFFSCGTSVQGAGARLAFSYARDGAVPGAGWISRVNSRFKTPVNALLVGAGVTILFILLVFLPDQGRPDRLHRPPGQCHASGGPGVVRSQRHLPVLPADGHRLDGRPVAGLDSRGPVPARPLGLAGEYRRCALPRPDAGQRRCPHRAGQPAGLLQPGLDHLGGHVPDRGRRRALLLHCTPGQGCARAPARYGRADRGRTCVGRPGSWKPRPSVLEGR